jgi:hypothetical protein
MRKLFVFIFLLFINICYSQQGDINFSIIGLGWELPYFTHVGKIDDNIYLWRKIDNHDYLQVKKVEDCVLQNDGFYVMSIFGNQTVVLWGGNYFFIHDLTDYQYSMYRKDKDYQAFFNANTNYNEPDYGLSGQRLRNLSSIIVPDVLRENKIIYSTHDMLQYYARMLDSTVVCNPDAKPWATSKDPIGMSIEVQFDTVYSVFSGMLKNESDHIVILNGYVNPLKRYLYKANRRIKTLKIESMDKTRPFSIKVLFPDYAMFHRIQFPVSVSKVKLTILDFYEGERYKDLCIQMIGSDFDMDSGTGNIPERIKRSWLWTE